MAQHESELTESLAASGARITNTRNQLRIILPESISFASASPELNSDVRPALRAVLKSLKRHPQSTVRVVGHTDKVGSAAFTRQLSQDRALSVARAMIAEGTSASRISYSGRGLAEPITSNATEAGRAQNRRIEIVIAPMT